MAYTFCIVCNNSIYSKSSFFCGKDFDQLFINKWLWVCHKFKDLYRQGGGITEDEFAKKIEDDLKSKHQPGLLPFLQV